MFDIGGDLEAARCCLDTVRELGAGGSEAELVDLLTTLEDLKAAAAAAQALAAEALDRAVRARHAAVGLPAADCGRGVAAQVALARHEAPSQGSRHLGLATALVREMPHTHAALRAGHLSEWRATILVRETACLTREHRGAVDAQLCADPANLAGVGDRALGNRARAIAYRLDAETVLRRAGKAEGDRRVTLRPAPDVMSQLSALMPVTQGVATYAALKLAADQARAAGDARTVGQLMADTLFERVTGRSSARAVPIEVQLVITDRALVAGDLEPAHLPGYGPVPARWARDQLRPGAPVADDGDADLAEVWLRRLYTHPHTGELVAMESRARRFPDGLRRFLVARDQTCRTPWCDAPIREADHATRHASGGPTTAANGQGLCQACNYAKEAPGWAAEPSRGSAPEAHAITLTAPTGHRYTSTPPPQPGHRSRPHAPPHVRRHAARHASAPSRLEAELARVLADAVTI